MTGRTKVDARYYLPRRADTPVQNNVLAFNQSTGKWEADIVVLGPVKTTTIEVTSTYTTADPYVIICDGTFPVNLRPAADGKFTYWIINKGRGTITLDPDADELIKGLSDALLAAGNSVQIVSDLVEWWF